MSDLQGREPVACEKCDSEKVSAIGFYREDGAIELVESASLQRLDWSLTRMEHLSHGWEGRRSYQLFEVTPIEVGHDHDTSGEAKKKEKKDV